MGAISIATLVSRRTCLAQGRAQSAWVCFRGSWGHWWPLSPAPWPRALSCREYSPAWIPHKMSRQEHGTEQGTCSLLKFIWNIDKEGPCPTSFLPHQIFISQAFYLTSFPLHLCWSTHCPGMEIPSRQEGASHAEGKQMLCSHLWWSPRRCRAAGCWCRRRLRSSPHHTRGPRTWPRGGCHSGSLKCCWWDLGKEGKRDLEVVSSDRRACLTQSRYSSAISMALSAADSF